MSTNAFDQPRARTIFPTNPGATPQAFGPWGSSSSKPFTFAAPSTTPASKPGVSNPTNRASVTPASNSNAFASTTPGTTPALASGTSGSAASSAAPASGSGSFGSKGPNIAAPTSVSGTCGSTRLASSASTSSYATFQPATTPATSAPNTGLFGQTASSVTPATRPGPSDANPSPRSIFSHSSLNPRRPVKTPSHRPKLTPDSREALKPHRKFEPFDPSSPIIPVNVGSPNSGTATFHVHQDVLCRSSDYLRTKSKEAQFDSANAIEILNHSPATFKLYVNWAYSGLINFVREHEQSAELDLREHDSKRVALEALADVDESQAVKESGAVAQGPTKEKPEAGITTDSVAQDGSTEKPQASSDSSSLTQDDSTKEFQAASDSDLVTRGNSAEAPPAASNSDPVTQDKLAEKPHNSRPAGHSKDNDWSTLAKAYVLGEDLEDANFKGDVLTNLNFQRWSVDESTIKPLMGELSNIIYGGTVEGSVARLFLVNLYSSRLTKSELASMKGTLPPDFVFDMLMDKAPAFK